MSKKKLLDRIVGSGFLANNFKKHESLFEKLNVCVYAAGVSNSQCVSSDLLEKDKKRLFNFKTRISENQMLIYFSTCSVNDPSRNKTPYIKNKIEIENFIQNNFGKYLIIRLPEIVGKSKNNNTLINFFFDKIRKNITFNLWSTASRNLIGIDDAIKILIDLLPKKNYENKIINIANPKNYRVTDIVDTIERLTLTKAKYNLINRGELNWKIDVSQIFNSIKNCKIEFNDNYLENILKKYFI